MLPPHEVVKVDLKDRSYNIIIGDGLFPQFGKFIKTIFSGGRVVIISDTNVSGLFLDTLSRSLEKESFSSCAYPISPGETSKNWSALRNLVEWLLKQRIDRDDLIIALGGGVVGDLAGFAASIVRRGIPVVQAPTTLLAQVDSSIGGKTGINSIHGKNLIGSFYQPRLVVVDISCLDSLSSREFLAGYSEVVKYGLLGDKNFFSWLDQNKLLLTTKDKPIIREAIKRSCLIKRKIVESDEKEKGQRALLNLGHTFGHALEAATGYSNKLLHGEAVSIGCVLAFELSVELGFCSASDLMRVTEHFLEMGLKVDTNEVPEFCVDSDTIFDLMLQDKKVKSGVLNLILVNGIGSAFILNSPDLKKLKSFLSERFG